MGAPQAGRRGPSDGHHTALLVGSLSHSPLCLLSLSVTLGHRDFRWDAGWARDRSIFYFLPWDGTSTYTILGLGLECDIVIWVLIITSYLS